MFVVTGLGHSGTGWASQLFTDLGYECGHEQWINPFKPPVLSGNDSSWLAVPFVNELDAQVIHLVRNPFHVARSYFRSGNEEWHRFQKPYLKFAHRHCPSIAEGETLLGRVLARVSDWDQPLFEGSHLRVRIEDCTPTRSGVRETQKMAEYATGQVPKEARVLKVLSRLGTSTNAHSTISSESPEFESQSALRERAALLGYVKD